MLPTTSFRKNSRFLKGRTFFTYDPETLKGYHIRSNLASETTLKDPLGS